MVAIRENEARAQMIGFNTFVYKLLAVTLAGVMAALAGLDERALESERHSGCLQC